MKITLIIIITKKKLLETLNKPHSVSFDLKAINSTDNHHSNNNNNDNSNNNNKDATNKSDSSIATANLINNNEKHLNYNYYNNNDSSYSLTTNEKHKSNKGKQSDFIDFLDVLQMPLKQELELIDLLFDLQNSEFNNETRILTYIYITNGYTFVIDIHCPIDYPSKNGCHCEKLACNSMSKRECKLFAKEIDLICKERNEKHLNCLIPLLSHIEARLSNKKSIKKPSISNKSKDELNKKTKIAVKNISKQSQKRVKNHYKTLLNSKIPKKSYIKHRRQSCITK